MSNCADRRTCQNPDKSGITTGSITFFNREGARLFHWLGVDPVAIASGSATLERGATMFQLFDLIITSPIGVFLFAKAQDLIYTALVTSDCDECGFNDLGKLLFGGLALALLIGGGVSILYWKKKEKLGNQTEFVSIRATTVKSEDAR